LKTREKNGEIQAPMLILFATQKKGTQNSLVNDLFRHKRRSLELLSNLVCNKGEKQWEFQIPLMMMVCWEKIHEKGEHEIPLSTLFITHKGSLKLPQ
jgi:hypothetical protein